MKIWNAPEVEELKINETAHGWTGIYKDGGYFGDGEIAGHLTWKKSEEATQPTDPANGQS